MVPGSDDCPANVGEALSLPPGNVTECLVGWNPVGHCTNSPDLDHVCGFALRGRLRASPTLACRLSQPGTQNRYRAPPRSPGGHTGPVRHCPRALPAKLQFTDLLSKSILYFRKYTKIIPIWQPICEKYLPNHYTWGYNSAKPYKAGIFHDCCD